MTPLQIRRFRLNYPSASDVAWLQQRLNRECARFGHRIELREADPPLLALAGEQ